MPERQSHLLTNEECMSPQGCGAGTETACFALALGPNGIECLIASESPLANAAGIQLGWRMNIDPTDNRPWCPKGLLGACKTVEVQPIEDPATPTN